jgi:protein phosphatase
MDLHVPDPSLVLLVGPSSSGKSTFARAHFAPTAVVSSDACRAIVADDENDQSATDAAFQVLHLIVAKRLERGRLTVVDATNVRPAARAPLLELAHRCHLPTVVVAFDLPEEVCEARRAARRDRDAGPEVLLRQREQLHRGLDGMMAEGHWAVHVLRTPEQVAAVRVARVPLPPDRRAESGPFDVVGDVHGCLAELQALLARLGYVPPADGAPWRHPEGRRVVFVGDLVDRGPRVADTLRLAMDMVDAGTALAVPGNHDDKLLRKLHGRTVHVAHGLEETLAELAQAPRAFVDRVRDFLDRLPSHLVLDGGRLVVAHAGLPQGLHGRESRRVRDRALFGETTGVLDADGLPMRVDWAARYQGRALVVFGHTPVLEPRWRNQAVDIDTGCVFGGALTALRWPERELVSVPAERAYAVPARAIVADPFVAPEVVRRREREHREREHREREHREREHREREHREREHREREHREREHRERGPRGAEPTRDARGAP